MAKKKLQTKPLLLKQSNIFSTFLSHEITVLSKNSEFQTFVEGETIFSAGDPGSSLYIIESGEIVIQKQEEYGPVIDIARLIKGNCFGELSLFTESSRDASAIATRETRILQFPKSSTSFAAILSEHPALSARILHKILVNFAGRIRSANALIKENSPLMQELKKQVYRDKLTGLYNQTYLQENIRRLIKTGCPGFTILITKPDNFKDLNDKYGHEAGDQAIKIMARRLRDYIGDDERTIRYKGNAMAVLVKGADRDDAYKLGVSIREFIKKLDLSDACGGDNFSLSASVGISLYPHHGTDPEKLLFQTHELPLRGRKLGGNLILFSDDRACI
ncbi:MAG: hypothetical protein B6241_03465 [Spirochaetaceae bacterium 4572_59]|nr:MAG: hypothetical protein B6241_03465 [Spirochaetaceae bacterium 4572_59]